MVGLAGRRDRACSRSATSSVSTAELGPGEAYDFLVRPRVGELLWNTTRLLVGGVLLSVVLGVGCAWLVVRTDLPLAGLWHGVLVRAARRAGVRQRLRLGLDDPRRAVATPARCWS